MIVVRARLVQIFIPATRLAEAATIVRESWRIPRTTASLANALLDVASDLVGRHGVARAIALIVGAGAILTSCLVGYFLWASTTAVAALVAVWHTEQGA